MNPLQGQPDQILRNLIMVCEDGVRGFETAAELLDAPYADTFDELGRERARLAVELHEIASRYVGSGVSDGSGSMKGAAHRAWMRLKDMVPGDNLHGIITAAEEGEDHALEQYDEALKHPLADDVREALVRQRASVQTSHDRVKAMQDATA